MSMTREEAIAMCESEWWLDVSEAHAVRFQLSTDRLCMPWAEFAPMVNRVLGRAVYTHEFADPSRLLLEMDEPGFAPTLDQIIEMIPAHKRIVIRDGRVA